MWCIKAIFWENEYEYRYVHVKVNRSDFRTRGEARQEAQKYCIAIGRLPYVLRRDLETITIHAGVHSFANGNQEIFIYTDYAEQILGPHL